jgi:ribosome-associated toxin RatA of RatAB toxin-antitoxin module
MWTQNRIRIQAPPETVFRLAAEVEFWPALLPHYRYVRVLRRGPGRRLVRMGASRDGIPVSWTSLQWLEPELHRITFRHVAGVTRGMVVEWLIEPDGDGADVTINHRFRPRWPLVGDWIAERVIGPHFVHLIAGKTLRRIKALAEGASLATVSSG